MTEPDSMFHVNKINTLPKLKKMGFEGIDASLEESLFEYGLIWVQSEPDEYFFIYRGHNDLFDIAYMKPSKFDSDFDWTDRNQFECIIGDKLENMDYVQKMFSLFNYYGYMEIFGSTYNHPFKIYKKSFKHLLADTLEELLDCTELNMDDMEPETRELIEKANSLLEEIEEERNDV